MRGGGVLQTEAAECGIACLATVARAHGRRESLTDLRRRFPVSLGGTSLADIIACADVMGFTTRAVRCELDELVKLQTPAILHWSLDHYVVLLKVSRGRAVISDPALGERQLPLAEVSRHFTGVALELSPAPNFDRTAKVDGVRLSDLWGRLSGFKPFLLQLFALTFFLQGIGLLTPLGSQLVIDDVIGRSDMDLLAAVVAGFGLLVIIQASIETIRGHIMLHAGQRMSIQLSGNLLRHLLRLPTDFFERRHVGDVLSRFGSLGPPQSFLTGGLIGVVLDALLVLPVAVVMVLYSPLLSGLATFTLLVNFGVRLAAFPTLRRYGSEALNLSARSDTVFLETVRGIRAIKIAGREGERHSLWQNTIADQQNVSFDQGRFNLRLNAFMSLWQGFAALAMLGLGAVQVIHGSLTLGMFFAFQAYAFQFSSRIGGLIGAFFTFRMLGLHLERLADIVHADTEPGLDGPVVMSKAFRGDLAVKDLKFRYGQFDPWIINGATFAINEGDSVAIIGPSGGGKSTLLKILIGLYAPIEGQVLFDGYPVNALGLKAVRERLGVVMQDDQLLSGSISDNIAFFDTTISQEKVEHACRLAHVHDDIMRMPMGYNSLIGDMGSILSGGQKQRLLLARALYKQPTILFMDEGTANLDNELERHVLDSLASLKITRIMVAHREAAIVGANRVFRVEGGIVTEAPKIAPVSLNAQPEGFAA
jgi:ATP-binding cassette subfamily B protein RaxB